MGSKLRLIFHSVVLTIYLLTILFQLTCLDFTVSKDERILDMFRYKERYFTGWNFVLHVIYFTLALTEDIQDYIANKTWRFTSCFPITYLKACLFTMLKVPCTTFVSSMFWGLYHYDRELVYPETADYVIPTWFNHIIHSCISIFVVLEFYFTAHHPDVSFKSALIGLTVINIIYYSVFFYHYSTIGRFLYPVFHQFNWLQMAGFILGIYFCTVMVTKIGISIQCWIKSVNYKKLKI